VDYYFIVSNVNRNKAGNYKVTVNAYDVNGNSASKSYNVVVKNRPVVRTTNTTTTTKKTTTKKTTYKTYTGKASVDTSSIVATAKSFVGYRYVRGVASPSKGFDCSGLVVYVYGLHGKKLGHGTVAQSKSGKAVARKDMQPGDIIIWSTKRNNYPTHAAIYIGNDKMVHAANTRTGVIISKVSYWEKYGGGHIATIRRV
jgi:cell wall-associated NlpC family hydrolase